MHPSKGLLLALALALPLQAQNARMRGAVYDSVAHAPLSGAIVQAARVDSTGGPRVFSAITDAEGRFAFDSLPPGSYGVGFQHMALTVLGLEAPLRAVRLSAGTSAEINLAIPPGAHVRALTCGGAPADSTDALVAGLITDAARGAPLAGAKVSARWVELGIVDKKFRTVPRDLSTAANEEGAFRLCGVASDAQVQLVIAAPGFRSISSDLTLAGGTTRYDVRLVDTALTKGSAAIAGRVTHADGSPVASGQMHLNELGLDGSISDGAFTITGVPAGTWSVDTRVIGYEPQTVLVDAVEGAPAAVNVKLVNRIQVLDAVQVFGKATGNLKTLNEILERKRTSFGTSFLPGNNWLASALYVSDVLQSARGFRYLGTDSVTARGCTESTSIMGTARRMVFRLDGARFLGSLSELQQQVPAKDVLAVEAFPDAQSIPALWRSVDACALVAVWTKR